MLFAEKETLLRAWEQNKQGLKPNISRVLFLCLEHLYDQTIKALRNDTEWPGIVAYHFYHKSDECIIYITDVDSAIPEVPPDLAQCILYARDLGCDILLFSKNKTFISPVFAETKTVPVKTVTEQMLTISTAHLSPMTQNILETVYSNSSLKMPLAFSYDILTNKDGYGWILFLHNEPETDAGHLIFRSNHEREVTFALYRIMALALQMGCRMLCFDADGPVVPYLPVNKTAE